jgi:uncharacterized OB-fold protein
MMKPLPEVSPVTAPYWESLKEGVLSIAECTCGRRWIPPRSHCPDCWSSEWRWVRASGIAHVVSWVVYHVAYHESLKEALPYNVALVQLEEGPKLITNIVSLPDQKSLVAGMTVKLAVQYEQEMAVARFRPYNHEEEQG